MTSMTRPKNDAEVSSTKNSILTIKYSKIKKQQKANNIYCNADLSTSILES